MKVVADDDRHHVTDAPRDAWQSFEAAIPDHPLVNIPTTHEPAYEEKIDAVAIAIPTSNRRTGQVESGTIVLGELFWSSEHSEDDRALTLLHEAIHLRVSDTMAARTVRSDVLRRQMRDASRVAYEKEPTDVASFKEQRGIAAFMFHLFPEEAWAEIYLRDHYADWRERRLVALSRLREETRADAASMLARIALPLHASWVAYELVSLNLVIGLDYDAARLARLQALKREWLDDLSKLSQSDDADAPWNDFDKALPTPLEAATVSEARFDKYCDAVLRLRPF